MGGSRWRPPNRAVPDDVPAPRTDPGSYRDPLSRVYHHDDRVFRVLRGRGVDDYRAATESPSYAAALDRGDVVGTWEPDDGPSLGETADVVLEHERLDLISYPYEWPHAMLKDAALLTLTLTSELIDDGLILKDATPYNVQFDGSRPRFIDIGSFESLPKGEPWYGYRQFCQLFLYPLWLRSMLDLPFQPWLRGAIDGITPEQMVKLLGRRGLLSRGVWTHGRLHAWSVRRYASTNRPVGDELRSAGFGPAVIRSQVRNLHALAERSNWSASASTWSDYGDRSHYTDDDLATKKQFVLDALTPGVDRVLDLGCNDGYFSRLCADAGRRVIAVDGDELVIDRLYRQLSSEGDRRITPLYMDLSDPSPSLGWRSMERASFAARARPDLTLGLALVHHLAITNTAPLDDVVAMFDDFGADAIVEFPLPEDPMVQRLLRNKRDGLFGDYSLERFEKAIGSRFRIERSEQLPSGTRHLFHLRRSTSG